MSIIQSDLLLGQEGSSKYQVSRSLRFNSADSAYLSRTPASAGNRRTWTFSCWAKWTGGGTLFAASAGNPNPHFSVFWNSDGTIDIQPYDGGYPLTKTTAAKYRDPAAWYHILISVDTTDATAADRVRLYVNGGRVTDFSASLDPSQNYDTYINTTNEHRIGRWVGTYSGYTSAYLAEIHFIDGQALTPSSFAETDATTGQWIPKLYSGSYGTNGFKLTFADNSAATATTLGKDSAGSNNWTPNNFSVTAGAGNDSLVDTPTSVSATDTGIGGEIRGNYCTLNPLESANTLSNGNLDVTSGSNSWKISASTLYVTTGKWYCEFALTAVAGYPQIGVYARGSTFSTSGQMGTSSTGYAYNSYDGNKINSSSSSSYGNSWTTGDVIGMAIDLDNGALYFSKNGTWQNSGVPTSGSSKTGAAFSLPLSTFYTVAISAYGSDAGSFNFGQRAFAYTAPSGFKALVDTNLTAPVIAKPNTVFDTVLWTGNNTGQTISLPGAFSPDLIWTKMRSAANNHWLFDVIRGADQGLSSSSTTNELTRSSSVTAFGSTGFTLGTSADVNSSAYTYVAWAWDAGSSTVTNTQGSITSSVRANANAGFSIVTYSGTGTTGTVGHGGLVNLDKGMIIVKTRTGASVANWMVYHGALGATKVLEGLNTTSAATTDNSSWNDTAPTSTVFTVGGTQANVNGSGRTFVAYCFAPVAGYSNGFSYTGNGSTDGPMVYLGFRPRWILLKRTDTSGDWVLHDTARDAYNVGDKTLYPNLSDAEFTVARLDELSNGFKLRSTSVTTNASGGTYIGFAFAESPFQFSRAR